jgi:hypothetical protein
MAMVAGQFAKGAAQYVATVAVQALANKIANEIHDNFTLANAKKVAKSLAPGKRNKAKRAAAVQMVQSAFKVGSIQNAPVAVNYRTQRFRSRASTTNYRVTNREFVTDVTPESDGSFHLALAYSIQPGIHTTFPWLSRIAQSHQKYKFSNIKFTWQPLVGTSTPGRIILAYAPDPLDAIPFSAADIYQYPDQCDSALWGAVTLQVPQKHLGVYFTRSGFVPDTDIKTYDNGVLYIATYGCNAASPAGSVFVEYDVELITPHPTSEPDGAVISITPAQDDGSLSLWPDGNTSLGHPLFELVGVSTSTAPNRVRFLTTGWICFTMRVFASTVDSIVPTVTNSGAATLVNYDAVYLTSTVSHLEMWIKVNTVTTGPHVYFDVSGNTGITAIAFVVTRMLNGTVVTKDFS